MLGDLEPGWLWMIGGVLLLIAIGGLVFEYHIRPAEH